MFCDLWSSDYESGCFTTQLYRGLVGPRPLKYVDRLDSCWENSEKYHSQWKEVYFLSKLRVFKRFQKVTFQDGIILEFRGPKKLISVAEYLNRLLIAGSFISNLQFMFKPLHIVSLCFLSFSIVISTLFLQCQRRLQGGRQETTTFL